MSLDKTMARMGIAVEAPIKIDYTGGAADKAKIISEVTIDVAAEGIEACRKIVNDHENSMDRVEEKIKNTPPTKKAKAPKGEIFVLREKLQKLQNNGNYRAAKTFVMKFDQDQKDAAREGLDELPGDRKSSVVAAPEAAAAAAAAEPKSDEAFAIDGEVAAVVQSAVEGSESAQAKLQAGAGVNTYISEVKAEVCTFVVAGTEKISMKLKRAPTRDDALKTVKAMLWVPPAVLPCLPAIIMLLGETKLKSQPGGKCTELCVELATAGPTLKVVPEATLPVVLAHMGSLAGANWQVKVATIGVLKEVLRKMGEPGCCPKQLQMMMPQVLTALKAAEEEKRKEVKAAAGEMLAELSTIVFTEPLTDEEIALLKARQERAREAFGMCDLPGPLRGYLETVVVSCCTEAANESAALAAVEAELRLLVPASAGSALVAFGLEPVVASAFAE